MRSVIELLRKEIIADAQSADARTVFGMAMALCDEPSLVQLVAAAKQPLIQPRFEVIGDIVRDHSTGLEWTRSNVPGERMEWAAAEKACAGLDLAGHKDWRLPTIKELLSIVDYDRASPAIDTDAFNCESAWYWSSTPYKPSPGDYAWLVYFSYGGANYDCRGYGGFVRAVRVGQF